MSNNYTKDDIKHWKYIWNDILSDVDFRNWITNKNLSYYQIYKNGKVIDLSNPNSNKKIGTLYMQFPGNLAHYMTFKETKKNVILFDSSYPNGTYSGCFPDFSYTVVNFFKKEIIFNKDFDTPQNHKNDSFCQTWSLCYLLNTKKSKELLKSSKKDSINSLYKICKYIIGMPVFEEICTQQESWINKNLKENKAPKKWDSKYFLNYSKKMTKEMFDQLF
jgi:hypothetical protein